MSIYNNPDNNTNNSNSSSIYDTPSQLENNINNTTNNTNNIPDIPFEMMEDENAMTELENLMQNPEIDPEAYQEMVSGSMNNQPPPFARFSQSYKPQIDDESWNGFKLSGEWNPMQTFKFDSTAILDIGKTSYKHNFVSINSSKTDPNKGMVVMGRYDPVNILALQCHTTFSPTDRVSLQANYPKCDKKTGVYEIEYSKSFDRLVLAGKLGNQGNGGSISANIYKNTHIGVEAYILPQTGDLLYSYALSLKPYKKLGIAAMYISYVPLYSLDIMYRLNNTYKMYFSYMLNLNPMIAMTGGTGQEIKLMATYKLKEIEASTSISQGCLLSGCVNYKYNDYLTCHMNAEIFPAKLIPVRGGRAGGSAGGGARKLFKSFGIGISGEYKSIESLQKIEDDLSEYEPDRI